MSRSSHSPRQSSAPSSAPSSALRAAAPAPRRLWPLWLRLVAYACLLLAAVAAREWFFMPRIPRPNLANHDPLVVLAIDDAEFRVRSTPQSADAWGELGLVLYAQAHAPEAVACFEKATSLEQRSWRWPFFAAAAQSHTDLGRAAELMEGAIARDPAAVWPRLLRAEWLVALGRGEEAKADYEALLRSSPDHARARLGLARLLLAEDRPEEASHALAAALDHPATRAAAHRFAAQIAARRGDTPLATAQIAAAAALPPDTPWPEDPLAAELPMRRVGKRSRIKLVSQMEQAGAVNEADTLTRRIEEQSPEIYLFVEGRMQMDKGNPAAAERAFRQAVEFDPRALEIHFQLGRSILAQQRLADAANVFRRVLAIEPGYGPAWLELGRCLGGTEPAAALAALRTAVAYMPTDEAARTELIALEAAATAAKATAKP